MLTSNQLWPWNAPPIVVYIVSSSINIACIATSFDSSSHLFEWIASQITMSCYMWLAFSSTLFFNLFFVPYCRMSICMIAFLIMWSMGRTAQLPWKVSRVLSPKLHVAFLLQRQSTLGICIVIGLLSSPFEIVIVCACHEGRCCWLVLVVGFVFFDSLQIHRISEWCHPHSSCK